MSKCLNCGKENPPSLSNRPRKYCSKKCTNQYYREELYVSTARPGWGDASKREKKAREERKAAYNKVIADGWINYKDAAPIIGITIGALNARVKNLLNEDIETTKVHNAGKNVYMCFISPAGLERLKQDHARYYATPKGFMTSKEVADSLGICTAYFREKASRYNVFYDRLRGDGYALFKHSTLKRLKGILDTKDKKDAVLRVIKRNRKQKAEAKAEEEFRNQIKGKIPSEEAMILAGVTTLVRLRRWAREGLVTKEIIKGKLYFLPEEIERALEIEYAKQRTKQQEAEKKRKEKTPAYQKWESKNYSGSERREIRYKANIPNNAKKNAIKSNREYWADHERGIIKTFTCNTCSEEKPYYNFYVDWTRTDGRCHMCENCKNAYRAARRSRGGSKKSQQKRTPDKRLKYIFASTIRIQISNNLLEEQVALTTKEIWKNIKQFCGYDEHDLVRHLESQFVGEMSWDNWGQIGTTVEKGSFCWHVDHIVPRSKLSFGSFDNPNFVACWGLHNLKPIEARMNLIKGNKKVREKMNKTFRKGLKDGKVRGIWKFLDYSPQEARDYFESLFTDGMTWKNYGELWQVDHICPQAYLSYQTSEDENFKRCWELANLQPLLRSQNAQKTSRWNDKIWLYNDE